MRNLAYGIIFVLAGCGGGGGSDVGGMPTASTLPTAGPSVAAGATTAPQIRPYVVIGRCFQCDGRYAAAGAALVLDGESVSEGQLLRGVVGVARGTSRIEAVGSGFRQTYAPFDSVDARSAVVGPIEWIDRARGRIGVLGQEIQGIGAWVGGEEPSPYGLDAGVYASTLQVGDRVRVEGFDTVDGIVLALAMHPARERIIDRIAGTVGHLDAAMRRLRIGALDVDYSGASVEEFPSGEVRVQDRVEAVGTLVSPSLLRATSVRLQESPIALAVGAEVAVVGLLRRATFRSDPSARDFVELRTVGQILRVSADCDGVRGLRDGDVVSLRGQIAVDGLLSHLEASGIPDVRCRAGRTTLGGEFTIITTVDSRNLAQSSWLAFGIPVQAQSATLLSDESGSRLELSQFGPGTKVRVSASGGAPPANAIAASIERVADAPLAGALFDAFMRAEGADKLVFLGRRILIDASTKAGLRDCSVPSQQVAPIASSQFIPIVFGRTGVSQRSIAAEVRAEPDGRWVAVRVEAYDYLYCD